jgi:hypothetical protein
MFISTGQLLPFAALVCSFVVSVSVATAEPIRPGSITVSFNVSGDKTLDPVFGNELASGSFSFSTRLIPEGGGTIEAPDTDQPAPHFGLGATRISLAWAGERWSTTNADIYRLEFDASGALRGWVLGGTPFGGSISFDVSPDFLALTFPGLPPGSPGHFNYSTPQSRQFGIFSGSITSWAASESAAPVPEPASFLLLGGALLFGGVRFRRQPSGLDGR